MTAGSTPTSDNDHHCETRLKEGDRAAWLAALFAPADKRPMIHALGAFALDIAEVRGKVREPLAGELRLQWWTDAIEGEARGDVRGHPVASALIETIRRAKLPRAAVTDIVEARRDDLYDEPIPSLDDYAKRADRIWGAFIGLAGQVLLDRRDPAVEAAARHAGRAIAVIHTFGALSGKSLPMHMTVPLDLLRAQGIGAAEVLVRRSSPALLKALTALHAFGSDNLQALRMARETLDPLAAPAFLTANLAAPMLKRARGPSYDPFATRIDLPPWRQQWTLWRASRHNGLL